MAREERGARGGHGAALGTPPTVWWSTPAGLAEPGVGENAQVVGIISVEGGFVGDAIELRGKGAILRDWCADERNGPSGR